MSLWLRQSAAVTLKIGPFLDDTDGKTAETGLTISQGDVRLSKAGGDMSAKGHVGSCTHDELGYYDCNLSAVDTATLGRLKLAVHESGALPVWHDYTVLPPNVYDALQADTDKLEVDIAQVAGQAQSAVSLAGIKVDTSAIAAIATEARLAELDAANLPTDVAAVKTDTVAILQDTSALPGVDFGALALSSNLSAVATVVDSVKVDTSAVAAIATEARLAELDAANLPTDVAAVKTDTVAILQDTSALPSVNFGALALSANLSAVATNVNAILVDTGSAGVVVAAGSKTGYALSATGLNAVDSALPSTVAVNLREMIVMLHQRVYGDVDLTSAAITVYAADGTTPITTQTVSETSALQHQGKAT